VAVLALLWHLAEVLWVVNGRVRQLAQSQLGPSTAYSVLVSIFICLGVAEAVEESDWVAGAVAVAAVATLVEDAHFYLPSDARPSSESMDSNNGHLRMPW